MLFQTKKILEIKWLEMPEDLKKTVKTRFDYRFRNDVIIDLGGEFQPCEDEQDWGESLTLEHIESYFKDQKEDNLCKAANIDEFIDEYGLHIEKWLLDQNVDLAGVNEIYIKISW